MTIQDFGLLILPVITIAGIVLQGGKVIGSLTKLEKDSAERTQTLTNIEEDVADIRIDVATLLERTNGQERRIARLEAKTNGEHH